MNTKVIVKSIKNWVYIVKDTKTGKQVGTIQSCSLSHAKYEAKYKFNFHGFNDFEVIFTGVSV